MNIFHKLFIISAMTLAGVSALAQETTSAQYRERYDMLVKRLGPSGLGIETLLLRWEKDFPDDVEQKEAAFMYYFSKSQRSEVVPKEQSKYLGEKPVLSLKDSLGNPVNYFQEFFYDDELFGKAISSIEKAAQDAPLRLDLRLAKITATVGYEKESPDMATEYLKALIDYNAAKKPHWDYPGANVDAEFFSAAVQEYCVTFFRYATPASFEAFKAVSEKMVGYEPKNVLFLDNLGSYWLVVKKDSKMAAKYYNKVLKLAPSDLTAIKNSVLMSRNDKNVKAEKKFLALLVKYTQDETERLSAQARLDALNK